MIPPARYNLERKLEQLPMKRSRVTGVDQLHRFNHSSDILPRVWWNKGIGMLQRIVIDRLLTASYPLEGKSHLAHAREGLRTPALSGVYR